MALRAADSWLASGAFGEGVDQSGREEHWFSVDDESLMFLKRDLHAIAEAVRAIDTDHPIYVWIQAENDSEYGLEVFRDTIKPD